MARDDLTANDGVEEEVKTEEQVEGEVKEEEKVEGEVAEEETPTEEPEPDATKEELAQMRQLLASQHKMIQEFKAKQAAIDKRLAGDIEDPEEAAATQEKLNAQIERRNDELDIYLETMRLNPKYEDVDSVCSQSNVDKLIHTLATKYVAEKGGDVSDAMDGIARELWAQRNPYSNLYTMVKAHVLTKASAATKPAIAPSKTGIKPGVDAPGTIANLGSGAPTTGGWTSARIDAMPESELSTVPADVYSKYLAGTLA